jgi:murein L,D-transpeptidase YafK
MKIRRNQKILFLMLLLVGAIAYRTMPYQSIMQLDKYLKSKQTVSSRIRQYGDIVQERLASDFKRIDVAYPSYKMIIVALKQEKLLEIWVSDPPKLLKSYPILAASGKLGPKLKQGDMQVPEGLYRIESLNPNSLYHLALRINYPNPFDKAKAELDSRDNLGGDIMIHGNCCSIGCIAIGDPAIEELFILAAKIGIENISVVISPWDFRSRNTPHDASALPGWTIELYDSIRQELNKLPKPPELKK